VFYIKTQARHDLGRMMWTQEQTTGDPPPLESRRKYHCAILENKLLCLDPTYPDHVNNPINAIKLYVLDLGNDSLTV
jgi:hypothetical protein